MVFHARQLHAHKGNKCEKIFSSNSALKPKSAQFLQLYSDQLNFQNWVWRLIKNKCGVIKKDMKMCWNLSLKYKKAVTLTSLSFATSPCLHWSIHSSKQNYVCICKTRCESFWFYFLHSFSVSQRYYSRQSVFTFLLVILIC